MCQYLGFIPYVTHTVNYNKMMKVIPYVSPVFNAFHKLESAMPLLYLFFFNKEEKNPDPLLTTD